eukprot:14480963-Alexandrium_andersonii.AAC.1
MALSKLARPAFLLEAHVPGSRARCFARSFPGPSAPLPRVDLGRRASATISTTRAPVSLSN